ncbi:efflux RND transporter periplasmic adaptor subunit [Caulobacter mirabilis]|nr:efflux RND transporter periplasmic adaptor subunit [Caulobacter mirabilis]
MIRRHFFLFIAAAFLVVMLVGGGIKLAFGDAKPKAGGGGPGGRAAAVSQTQVADHAFVDRIEVLGAAKGRQAVTITSNTTELVTAVRFQDGQQVAKGQVLVELKANEQDAGLIEARARLAQAERDYKRWSELAERGVAPRATAEQYLSALETARASVAAADSRKLDRVIRAPFSGVVGLTDVAPGTLIQPGAKIVSLDDLSTVRVDFNIPDRYLPVLAEGAPIAAKPDAWPNESFNGRIAQLDSRIDPATRAIVARAEFPNPAGRIKPGMLMRVTIAHGGRQAPAVPEAAIQFEADQAYAFVIDRKGEGSVARKQPIQVGVTQDGFVEILGGLKPGERIVADGLNRIQNGQAVRVGGGKGGANAGQQAAR